MRSRRSRRSRTNGRPPPCSTTSASCSFAAAATPQAGQPAYYFNKAAEADPDDPDYFFNLGYAYWLERDTQAAIYWLREAVRRNPADGDAHFVLGAALSAAGNAAEAAARRSWRGGCRRPTRSGRSGRLPMRVPKGLERVKSDVELPHGAADRSDARRAADSAISRSWRASISIAAGGCFSRRTIARRSPS